MVKVFCNNCIIALIAVLLLLETVEAQEVKGNMEQLYIRQMSVCKEEIQNEHIVVYICKKRHRYACCRVHRSRHRKTGLVVDDLTCGYCDGQHKIYHKAEYQPKSKLL